MKKMNLIVLLFLTLIFVLPVSNIHAQDNFKKVAQSGMQYLKIGIDAKMVGRGEAGISAVEGLSSIFWNPAGLSSIEDKEVFFSHNSWIADISLDAAGVGINFDNFGTFALSLVWMNYGTLKATSVATTTAGSNQLGYIDEGTFSPTDLALGLAYSKKISDQFSVGGQVKYLYENYGHNVVVNTNGTSESVDNIVKAVAFDLGTIYYPGYKSFAFAMTIQNFSTDIKYEEESFGTPLTFKLGVSMNMLDIFDEKSASKLLVAVDAIHPRDYTERLNLGIEYDYLGLIQLRSGYRLNYDIGNFTAGMGLNYSISSGTIINLDLSYMVDAAGRFTNPIQITAGLKF